jgi:protein-S-isoprenylcysteine O-methyltransferase Ste14
MSVVTIITMTIGLMVMSTTLWYAKRKDNSTFKHEKKYSLYYYVNLIPGAVLIPAYIYATIAYFLSPGFKDCFLPVTWLSFLGWVLFIVTAVIYCDSIIYMGKSWCIDLEVKDNHKIVTGHMFKYVRHPVYSALIFTALAMFFITGYVFLLAFFFLELIWFFYRARQEEKLLSKVTADYINYMKKTKMFLPLLF